MSWSKVVLCLFVGVLFFDSARTVHSRHNRAGRHRRVPDPGPEPVVQVFGEVQEQQQNKHKPVFENCENFQPSVNEEASRGRTHFNKLFFWEWHPGHNYCVDNITLS